MANMLKEEMHNKEMNDIVTIKGKPVIDIYESFNGSYWYVVDRAYKQDSLINGKVYRKDQIYFGYVRLANCPEFAEFGYFSEAELQLLGPLIWKVPKENWPVCPEVEVKKISQENDWKEKSRCEAEVSQPHFLRSCAEWVSY